MNNFGNIYIYNTAEPFYRFLSRAGDNAEYEQRLLEELEHGDTITLCDLEENCVVITSLPIHQCLKSSFERSNKLFKFVYPLISSHSLCNDIAADPALRAMIKEYADARGGVEIHFFAATEELVVLLRILVHQERVAILNYDQIMLNHTVFSELDCKVNFRAIVGQDVRLTDLFLPYMICDSIPDIYHACEEFSRNNVTCILKAGDGEGGIGMSIISPGQTDYERRKSIKDNMYLTGAVSICEQYIDDEKAVFPSIELYIPADGSRIQIAYICTQLKLNDDIELLYCGPDLSRERWFEAILEIGSSIGEFVARKGYIGYFDIDCVVTGENRTYVLECNLRRTTGTYMFEYFRRSARGICGRDKLFLASCSVYNVPRSIEVLDVGDVLNAIRQSDSDIVFLEMAAVSGLKYGRITIYMCCKRSHNIRNVAYLIQKEIALLEDQRTPDFG